MSNIAYIDENLKSILSTLYNESEIVSEDDKINIDPSSEHNAEEHTDE